MMFVKFVVNGNVHVFGCGLNLYIKMSALSVLNVMVRTLRCLHHFCEQSKDDFNLSLCSTVFCEYDDDGRQVLVTLDITAIT